MLPRLNSTCPLHNSHSPQSHVNPDISFTLLRGKNPSATFCFPHITFLTCSWPSAMSLQLLWQWDGRVSLITSVCSASPPRPSLKLKFSTAENWIFTRIFNPEGKKPDKNQEGWVFSPWKLCEVGFGWVMEALSRLEGLSWGWGTKSSEAKNCDHPEMYNQHQNPLYQTFFPKKMCTKL